MRSSENSSQRQASLISAGHQTAVLRRQLYASPGAGNSRTGWLGRLLQICGGSGQELGEKRRIVAGLLNAVEIIHPDSFIVATQGKRIYGGRSHGKLCGELKKKPSERTREFLPFLLPVREKE